MEIDFMMQLFWLLAALGGGFFGAAVGGNFSFVITGFVALMGLGGIAINVIDPEVGGIGSTLLGYLAFGPFIGPHVAFGGAVAGAAYAAQKGYTENGKDIVQPLARLGKPDVLMVGALFGLLGHVIQQLLAHIPWWMSHADTVAWTVFLSALIVRIAFGKNATNMETGSSLINAEKMKDGLKPYEGAAWLRHMETPGQLLPLGFFVGLLAAGAALYLTFTMPGVAGSAHVFGWAVSAVTILFLNIGYNIPVTHHITIIASIGAVVFFPILMGGEGYGADGYATDAFVHSLFSADGKLVGAAVGALIIGALWGIIAAFLCEWGARVFYNRGTTHIDPPAISIMLATTLIWLVALIVQAIV
jgi:hypothetical protein